ncbi:MAG: hypothetical protein HYY93_11155 [Planctomycetes bacterium]|nr:hypothetical protein [Planctomycetota bacterium]
MSFPPLRLQVMTRSARLSVGLLLALAGGALHAPSARADDLGAILESVKTIASPGSPGTVAVWGREGFPIVADKEGRPVVAATPWTRGRIVALGHDGFGAAAALGDRDTGRLLVNLIAWCAPTKKKPRVGVLHGDARPWLAARGIDAASIEGERWWLRLMDFDVLWITEMDLPEEAPLALTKWIRAGGGLICATTGWGWQQIRGGRPMIEGGLNRLLAPAGIGFTNAFAEDTAPDGFAVGATPPAMSHGLLGLEALIESAEKASKEDLRLAAQSAIDAIRLLPPDDSSLRPRIEKLMAGRGTSLVPTPESPIGEDRALDRFVLAYQVVAQNAFPPAKTKAHPAAAAFPGAVPKEARTVHRTFTVDPRVPGWHSTGLYAPAGQPVTLVLPKEAARGGLSVRIGAHTDELWGLDTWPRVPAVSRVFPLTEPRTDVASAFGGLLYIEVPDGAAPGPVKVAVSGAVEAPYFELDRTKPEEWKRLRSAPGPWAELATRKVILTVPSAEVRDLDDPTPLLRFWDMLLDAAADLASIPRDRPRPERYAADVEISAGYMHSGYPIMTHLDAARTMSHLDELRRGNWGLFHELGHNHQEGDWSFDGTGEVTCNLWSLYLCEQCGVKSFDAHEGLKDRQKRFEEYAAKGRKFETWKEDPFLALQMYAQVQEAFGWDAFKRVFAEYRALKPEERPKTDDEKRDQWLVRLSRTVKRNLGPFFESWGIPTSAAARESIRDLPEWRAGEK